MLIIRNFNLISVQSWTYLSSLKEFVACLICLRCQWNSNVLNVAQEWKSVKNQAGSKVKGKRFPEGAKMLEMIRRFETSDSTVLYINYTLQWFQTYLLLYGVVCLQNMFSETGYSCYVEFFLQKFLHCLTGFTV